MNINISSLLVIAVLSVLITSFLIFVMRKLSSKLGLIDKPNHRKVHSSPVPVIGGICIFASVFIELFINQSLLQFFVNSLMIFIPLVAIVIMAVMDDKFNIAAIYRLIIQLICGFVIAFAGYRIKNLHGFLGIHEIHIYLQYFFTIGFIAFATNAYNLMDGIDGLLGSIALINMLCLNILCYLLGLNEWMIMTLILSISIAVFLRSNFSKNKIFMGDGGSMGLGFLISVISLVVLQRAENISTQIPVFQILAALAFIPLVDAIRVFTVRILKGKSAFEADKSHLHHLTMVGGLKHYQITLLLAFIHISFLIISYFVSISISTYVALFILGILFRMIIGLLVFNRKMEKWVELIKEIENM
jgi:UDP-GlcNAc:undecaprenyl-phosphate GlcNAc-1-phosphate transferase